MLPSTDAVFNATPCGRLLDWAIDTRGRVEPAEPEHDTRIISRGSERPVPSGADRNHRRPLRACPLARRDGLAGVAGAFSVAVGAAAGTAPGTASRTLRSTRSSIQCGSHHST